VKRKYTYDLTCPCCKRETIIETNSRAPLPVIYCQECNEHILIELEITRVYVDGTVVDDQDAISLFHQLNEQRRAV
jgi:hypothetical protein